MIQNHNSEEYRGSEEYIDRYPYLINILKDKKNEFSSFFVHKDLSQNTEVLDRRKIGCKQTAQIQKHTYYATGQ